MEVVQSLIDFPLLKLSDNFHILLADGIILEVIELGGIIRKIKQIDLPLMILVEPIDILLNIEVMTAYMLTITLLILPFFR